MGATKPASARNTPNAKREVKRTGKVPVAVVGATGYAGVEIVRLLSSHPDVELTLLTSEHYQGRPLADVYPFLRGSVSHTLERLEPAVVAKRATTVFTALPHGESAMVMAELLTRGCRVIDLGADFRLRDKTVYRRWYGDHPAPALLGEAVYGLAEIYRNEIRSARLVANPGCYPTGMLLGTLPLVRHGCVQTGGTIIVDAKSGATGAGRSARTELLFCEVAESIRPYNIGIHRHTPEMEQELGRSGAEGLAVIFAPHLLPARRGILTTVYVPLNDCLLSSCEEAFKEMYATEPFIDLLGQGVYPAVRDVQGTNRCAIGWWFDDARRLAVVVTAIDNLGKGAAGQAIQCLNLQLGCPETTALDRPALVP
jgi:N-acetyl-gamma-glutamyl-phosphate reductase